jgi:hypothetical protein
MAINAEAAEASAPRAEKLESGAMAQISAQAWTADVMRGLTNAASVPQEFGDLQLFDDSKQMIAEVDATIEAKTGTLTVTEQTGNEKYKKGDSVSVHIWSGNGPHGIGYEGGTGADGHCDNMKGHGPIPKGDYLIGNSYEEKHVHDAHPGGDATWYKLYGKDGKGGYSHEVLWNGRGVFALHTGLRSDGCVTVPSDVGEDDPSYPHSNNFDRVKDILDNTAPEEYKESTFRGWLHVK